MVDKKKLIESKEFDEAVADAAELKKSMVTTYKSSHKSNYERFYTIMLDANPDIKKILDTRKKNRSDDDKKLLQSFKQRVGKTYSQVRDFMTPEQVEEGKQTKIEKLVEKIAVAIDMLRYVDSDVLDKVFKKAGLVVTSQTELQAYFDSPTVKDNVKDIFNCAVGLKQKIKTDNDKINEDIYTSKVPVELQYDKKANNAGLKPGDFRKLVDMKAKLDMAKSDEAKEKVEDKIEKAATDKQFEVARAELVRDKLTKLQ